MKWVTLEHIGVDRMASIWLIRRWIDPKAEFIFVPAGTTPPPKAEPFDIPGERNSHHDGHCTFYALLHKNNLKDPILARIASIVDEADVIQDVNVEPAAQGLDLICRGIRRISANDKESYERGCMVYDALYSELLNGEN
jgi:hypothetical protein